MKEIRLHGRGGQGASIAAEMLAAAFVLDGKYASSFPMHGFERRGAPVTAFVRVDERPIREKTQIYTPDCLMVLDPMQKGSPTVYAGLKPSGILVLNTPGPLKEKPDDTLQLIGAIDATHIALQQLGIPATNTCILGAFAATTRWLTLGSILSSIGQYFKGDLIQKNIRCAQKGFEEVVVHKGDGHGF